MTTEYKGNLRDKDRERNEVTQNSKISMCREDDSGIVAEGKPTVSRDATTTCELKERWKVSTYWICKSREKKTEKTRMPIALSHAGRPVAMWLQVCARDMHELMAGEKSVKTSFRAKVNFEHFTRVCGATFGSSL